MASPERIQSVETILQDHGHEIIQEYIATDLEVEETLRSLKELDLPIKDFGPPEPPSIKSSMKLPPLAPSKKKKKKTPKMPKDHLISTRTIKGIHVPEQFSKSHVDTSALERLLHSKKAAAEDVTLHVYQSQAKNDDTSMLDSIVSQRNMSVSLWREAKMKLSKLNESVEEIPNEKSRSKAKDPLKKIHQSLLNKTKRFDSMADIKQEEKEKSHSEPLESFDDPFYETMNPLEMIRSAKAKNEKGARAFSRYFQHGFASEKSEWDWLPCYVLDYDDKEKLFTIEWIPSGIRKKARRLNILFDGEDREVFYERIEHAVRTRNEYEKESKHQHNIEAYLVRKIAPLSRETKVSMIERIGMPIKVGQLHVIVYFNPS